MALPKQVQAQLAEVEKLEDALRARADGGEQPRETEEATQEAPADTHEAESGAETEESAAPGDAKPADTPPTDVADDFRQKYLTLRGKYDAEVPRLHEQVRHLTEQLDQLRKQLAERAETSGEPTKPKEEVSYVTDADREEFGEELIDVQRRVAKEVAKEYEARLEQQAKTIEELREQVRNTGTRVGEMSFAQRLQQLVPDFAEVDRDERWIAWLNEYDPMLRGPRRAQAEAAYKAGDAEAVAHYVQLWRDSLPAPKEQPKPDSRQAELEKQVAPTRSAAPQAKQNTGPNTKVYSQRELSNAWEKIRVLNSRGQLDDAAKLEAEITAAYLEGRVRP